MSASFENQAVHTLEQRKTTYSFRDLFKETKNLSNREREVAHHVALGQSNKEIATDLFIAEKTVKFHLTNVFKKVRVKNRTMLIVAVIHYRSAVLEATL